MNSTRFVGAVVAAFLFGVMAPVETAFAEVTNVAILDSGPMGTFGGREYTWVTAMMEGSVDRDDGTTGRYRVPITLNYPDRDSNGFGFVDVVNNADFSNFTDDTAPFGQRLVHYTGADIFSDFLRTEGFTYISVQWSKAVTELLGADYGVIENGVDGYQIIRDAAALLRDPEDLASALAYRPEAVEGVIGHGISSSGGLLRGMVWSGQNRLRDGGLALDGFLLTSSNGQRCRVLNNDDTLQDLPGRPSVPMFAEGGLPCLELPDDGRIILVRTQSEVENRGNLTGENPNERVYDVAGVAHVPEFVGQLRQFGANRQNPTGWRPVAKAMLRHLVTWIRNGDEPPATLRIEGAYDDDGRFQLAIDEDGNALGGIRLPHMATLLPNGERAGAPMGVYGGRDPDFEDRTLGYGYAVQGGTFEAFLPEEIRRRYPTQEAYVDLVRMAAVALLDEGYISPRGLRLLYQIGRAAIIGARAN